MTIAASGVLGDLLTSKNALSNEGCKMTIAASGVLGDLHTSKNALSDEGCEMTIAARPKPVADKDHFVTVAGLTCAQVLNCAQDVPCPSCSDSCL